LDTILNDDDLDDDYHKNMEEDIFHGASDHSQGDGEAELIESPRAMLKKMRDASRRAAQKDLDGKRAALRQQIPVKKTLNLKNAGQNVIQIKLPPMGQLRKKGASPYQ
jgi:hypothetical protein